MNEGVIMCKIKCITIATCDEGQDCARQGCYIELAVIIDCDRAASSTGYNLQISPMYVVSRLTPEEDLALLVP